MVYMMTCGGSNWFSCKCCNGTIQEANLAEDQVEGGET